LTKGEPATGSASAWITEHFETRDPDELLAYLNRHRGTLTRKITPLGRTSDFRLCRDDIHLGRVRLARSRSTSGRFYVETLPSSLLTVFLSERGQFLMSDLQGRTQIVSNRGDAAIAAGVGDGFFESSITDTRSLVQIPRSEFLEQLHASGGVSTNRVDTWAKVDLSTVVGKDFQRALSFIWHQQAPPNELLRAAYDEILLHGLVSLLGPLLCCEPPLKQTDPGPAHVQRACELIRARVAEPIRIAEIARELGISPRHLQSGFRRHLGMTPHRFLRDCRLDEAHRLLSAAGPGHTTTTIAYDCGFGHLSDFAHDYRSRFGEPPSETLRRGRAAS
jgi:AraC-like DNA-binding protein